MKTIAISRLIGSNASEISRRVADALQYDLVDKAVLQGTLEQYGFTRFGKLYSSTPNLWDLTNSKNLQIISMLNDTMKALAYRGRTVILARGAYSALSNFSDVLKVRIQSSKSSRVDRVMAREGLTDRNQTEKHITSDDKSRQKFVKLFYNQKCCDATEFDLVINTAIVSTQTTENWIIETARKLESMEFTADAKTSKQTEVDPLLLDAIELSLKQQN